ncbi:MAG: pyruvate ferredoxin oxidoreductase [Candidatus Aenigmatarchaeota archaeon]
MKKVIEGSHAIAEAVRLCAPKVIAAYPITPQTHIVEKLAEMVANGDIDAEYINVESEHSAMAACIGAQATGVRTFTATCSQGLALMWELLYVASGMRLPIVMAVTNRALSAPLNIWGDWSDSMGTRDSGWIQLYCKNAQEALDTTIQAYRIAEQTMIPVMVCVDGFYLSHTLEPVDIPETLNGFVGRYEPKVELNPEKPVTQGAYATPDYYQEFKETQHRAIEDSEDIIKNVHDEFANKFSRSYGNGVMETWNMNNAKHAIVTMGTVSGTIKHVISNENIKDIGILRLRSFRPFPSEEIKKVLEGIESVGVIEKDISPGIGGALYVETKAAVKNPVCSFITGLGGRDTTPADIKHVFSIVRKNDTGIHWLGSKLG